MIKISTIKELSAEINGNTLSYYDNQLENATTVILMHPFGFNKNIWNIQLKEFMYKYRIVSYDIRGHGKSGIGDGQYSLDLFAEDLIGLIDHLKLEKVVLCGISMGGYIALRANELRSSRFTGLILCDTKSYSDSNEEKMKRFNEIKEIKDKGIKYFAEEMMNKILSTGSINNLKNNFFIKESIESNSVTGICGTLLALASRTDTSENLKKIKVPALILSGEKDKSAFPVDSQYLKHFIPDSELHIIPKASYMANIENPSIFNRVFYEFVEKKIKHQKPENELSAVAE
jgi:3-oxoadipate enol-lactonase